MILCDIGIGLVITVIVALAGGLDPAAHLIAIGLAASIAPDWDMIAWMVWRRLDYSNRTFMDLERTRFAPMSPPDFSTEWDKWKLDEWAHRHRDISHYPLLTIPISALAIYYWLGSGPAMITALCVFAHYLGDSGEIGWGIKWLRIPFVVGSKKYYFIKHTIAGEKRWFFGVTKDEQDDLVRREGNADWAKDTSRWKSDIIFLAAAIIATSLWYWLPTTQ